jgi:hypothetical protein
MAPKTSDPSPALVTHIYTADPSAHVFPNDPSKVYIYPSHDRETDIQFNDSGDQYDMMDYHVISTSFEPDDTGKYLANAKGVDHGIALSADQVPWVSKQMWAPDAAYNASTNKYHLFFPARDKAGRFRLGVAVGDKPEGPFQPQPEPMKGSYSIDPASFVDDDGSCYVYFGGIWGGELQCYKKVQPQSDDDFDESQIGPKEPSGPGVKALGPRVGKLDADYLEFDSEGVKEIQILAPETGEPIDADDHERRFFEASWVHKREDGKYVFSYSTGDTHFICYAVGDGPLGPFTYEGKLLEPVVGWTNHHSVCKYKGRWYVFYHDCEMSEGVSHLRSVKVREVTSW